MDIAAIQKRLQENRHAANIEHIFGNVFPAGLQVSDIRRLFEDFGDVMEVKFNPTFSGERGQMQPSIGRPTRSGNDCRGIFKRLAGQDIAWTQIGFDQIHHHPA